MKVEIWSDFSCPFCYIGKRRFEEALENFEHRDKVEVTFRSFQLDPNAKKNTGIDFNTLIIKKYGVTMEDAKANAESITKQAENVGLKYNMDGIILTNTSDAHRLSYFAKDKGKMNEFMELTLKAYFTDSLDVGDHKVLVNIAKEVGLDEKEALEVLKNNKYMGQIEKDMNEGARLGIQGVPFFLINETFRISGAQPMNVFLNSLQRIIKEEL